MTGFEQWISGIGSERSTTCAATTAQKSSKVTKAYLDQLKTKKVHN